ncbi:MAG: GNAT family N-acetyltransferase [Desulfovibrio sp.]|nr:GNAT family N-acetyltransferase [Desulfovibrio sp.]
MRDLAQRHLEIRVACPATDAESLLAIYSYYVKNTAITFEYNVPSLLEFTNRIQNTLINYPWIVATADGVNLGYAYSGRFKNRDAYAWACETSIYVREDYRQFGLGRLLYQALEAILVHQHVFNCNACITWSDTEDDRLSHASVFFHQKMGYTMVGTFHKCGYKFAKWYDMLWMEKALGEHTVSPQAFVPFNYFSHERISCITANLVNTNC